jgi:hypothetical protein
MATPRPTLGLSGRRISNTSRRQSLLTHNLTEQRYRDTWSALLEDIAFSLARQETYTEGGIFISQIRERIHTLHYTVRPSRPINQTGKMASCCNVHSDSVCQILNPRVLLRRLNGRAYTPRSTYLNQIHTYHEVRFTPIHERNREWGNTGLFAGF